MKPESASFTRSSNNGHRPTGERQSVEGPRPKSLLTKSNNPRAQVRFDQHDLVIVLAQLPPIERHTLLLGYFGGLTQVEISVRLQRTRSEIAAAMRSGLQAIACAIGELDAPSDLVAMTDEATA